MGGMRGEEAVAHSCVCCCCCSVLPLFQIPNVASQVQWTIERAKQLEHELKKAPSTSTPSQTQQIVASQMSPAKIR